jgi:hypothetical protein
MDAAFIPQRANWLARVCVRLAETAPVWRKLLAPWAERISLLLWQSTSRTKAARQMTPPATRLTQSRRRNTKGSTEPIMHMPKPEHVCPDCGITISARTTLCSNCAKQATGKNFRMGRKSAKQPEALAKRSATQRQHKQAIHSWKPSDLPDWLTRDVYVNQIQPRLASVPKSQIRSLLVVSEPYSSDIRAGKRIPHARHWQALAQLVGVTQDS